MTSKLNKITKTSTRGKLVAKARQADASVSAHADEVRRCTIPLNMLVPDPQNVRRFNSEAGIDQLCAMIATNGLLQNLDVRPAPKGKYFVTAGARRLRALKELGKRGTVIETEGVKVTGAYPVAVMILSTKHRPTEVSLVENLGRTNMPVADEVEAFRKLTEEDGFSPEQIGDRFGISHTTVRRRVKLAKVSGKIMEEFRAGHVTLDQMAALAVADDHAEQ